MAHDLIVEFDNREVRAFRISSSLVASQAKHVSILNYDVPHEPRWLFSNRSIPYFSFYPDAGSSIPFKNPRVPFELANIEGIRGEVCAGMHQVRS